MGGGAYIGGLILGGAYIGGAYIGGGLILGGLYWGGAYIRGGAYIWNEVSVITCMWWDYTRGAYIRGAYSRRFTVAEQDRNDSY